MMHGKSGLSRAALAAALLCLAAATGWTQAKKMHRVVFELTTDNPDQWQAVLNNVENLRKAFGAENTEIELVAHGKGLGLLRKEDEGLKERIAALAGSGVRFAACENSMRKLQLKKEDLLPVAVTVDSGVAEVVRKQEAGWAYLKSGS